MKLRPVLGPQGPAEPTQFAPWVRAAVASAAPEPPEPIDGGYLADLPEPFATEASFGPEGWLTGQPLAALEKHGFVCMRQLIPEYMHEPAFGEVAEYFMAIGASFLGGHAIDKAEGLEGFDKWCELPAEVWERMELGTCKVVFEEIPRFTMDEETGLITSVEPGGCAQKNGVKVGWRVEVVSDKKSTKKFSQPLAAKLASLQATEMRWKAYVQKVGAVEIEFQQMHCWTPYAIKQRWGVFATQRGFQPELGLGKCTEPEFMALPMLREVQEYVKPFVAAMHKIPPRKLCWQPEGASLKGRGQPLAAPHRDAQDLGREQIIIALSAGDFSLWPGCTGGYWLREFLKRHSCQLNFACRAGDVLIFKGGVFVHGSPPVGPNHPAPRVMTYAKFWPPGTPMGQRHAKGQCQCFGVAPAAGGSQ